MVEPEPVTCIERGLPTHEYCAQCWLEHCMRVRRAATRLEPPRSITWFNPIPR
jgi:hypothetical protein